MRNYLLSGRTGVGKSSFVNSFFGEPIAAVNDYEACTQLPEYHTQRGGIDDLCLIDTPGLAEGDGNKDEGYLQLIADRIDRVQIDGLLYVTPLNDPRFRPEEELALTNLTNKLGPRIWWSSWLVFTFAGEVEESIRRVRVAHRLLEFTQVLDKLTAGPNPHRQFRGFRQVLLVDNIQPRWDPSARPLASFLRCQAFDAPSGSNGDASRAPPIGGDEPPAVAVGWFPDLSFWLRLHPRSPAKAGGETMIGIDLGTAVSRASRAEDRTGLVTIIPCASGASRTPSAVFFGQDEVLVGDAAVDLAGLEDQSPRVVFGPKRFLGKDACLTVPGPRIPFRRANVEILAKLIQDAEADRPGPPIRRAILTHPADLGPAETQDLLELASEAGLNEVALLEEPLAVAIAHDRTSEPTFDQFLVIDCGASRISFAFVSRTEDGSFRIALPSRSVPLAGNHFDETLYDHLDELARTQAGAALGVEGRRDPAILLECRRFKEALSQRGQVEIRRPTVGGGRFRHMLRRAEFEDLIRPAVERVVQVARGFHQECIDQASQVDAVLLVGGASRVPLLRASIRAALDGATLHTPHPETAVALGAGYQALDRWGQRPVANRPRLRSLGTTSLADLVHRLQAREAEERIQMEAENAIQREHSQQRVLDRYLARADAIEVEIATLRQTLGLQLGDRDYTQARETLSALLRHLPNDPELRQTQRLLDDQFEKVGEVRTINVGEAVLSIALTPDGQVALVGPAGGNLKGFNLASGARIQQLSGHTGEIRSVALSPHGDACLTGGQDQTVRIWPTEGLLGINTPGSVPDPPTTGTILSIAQLRMAQAAAREANLRAEAIRRTEASRRPSGSAPSPPPVAPRPPVTAKQAGHGGPLWHVAYLPGGDQILSCGEDHKIRMWDAVDLSPIRTFEGHTKAVNKCDVSPDGSHLISCSEDGTVRLWDVDHGREERRMIGHTGNVEAICFFPGGRLAVSGGNDATLRVWDIATGRELGRWEGHTAKVWSVAFTPDGRHAVSVSDDKTVRVWDASTGWQVRQFEGHTNNVRAVAVSRDGRYAVSGGLDNTIRLWALGI